MQGYIVLPMLAAGLNAACAGAFLVEDPNRAVNRLTAAMLTLASFWALCEVAWNLAPDLEGALFWMRLSTPGWIFIGPIVLHIVLASATRRRAFLARAVLGLYGVSAVFLVLGVTTDWLISEAVQTAWGHGYRVGPAYPAFYVATMVGVIPSVSSSMAAYSATRSQAMRRQKPAVVVAIMTPFVVASLTDVLLPVMGVQVPRLGTTSFAVLGAVAVAHLMRSGHSFLSPGSFANEILATLSDGVVLLHGKDQIRSANPAFARMSGYASRELVAMHMEALLTGSLAHAQRDAAQSFETQLIRRDAERIPVSVASAELFDRSGLSIGLVVVVRDLREVYELRHRLVTSARLAAVGELAAGIAHEINNPIAYVRANLTQLQGHWKTVRNDLAALAANPDLADAVSEAEELVLESIEGVDRAAEIVKGVKGFAHSGTSVRQTADVNRLLDDVLRMAEPQLRRRVGIERHFAKLPPICCAAQELKQVFLNLVLNAEQAMEDDGHIRIETRHEAGSVVVRVADDGPGIPAEILDRIFDPFFTTKKVGEGTGLGLGIAYQIVRAHGGDISAASEPGHGAVFTLRLPIDSDSDAGEMAATDPTGV